MITEDADMVDPELRLRTVRTAASTIAEAERTESLREQWRKRRQKSMARKGTGGKSWFRRGKETTTTTQDDPRDKPTASPPVPSDVKVVPTGMRRDIFVNIPPPPSQLDSRGEPLHRYASYKFLMPSPNRHWCVNLVIRGIKSGQAVRFTCPAQSAYTNSIIPSHLQNTLSLLSYQRI